MKKAALIIAIIMTLAIIYTSCININQQVIFYCPIEHKTITISHAIFRMAIYFAGIVAGGLFTTFFTSKSKEELSAYKNRCEKLSVVSDSSETKINALETKIQTLEIALKNALNKNN